MFEKMKLKKQIKKSKDKIAEIEQKRSRSQAALIEAILNQTTPDDTDVEFFNNFTAQINEERENLHRLQKQYDELEKK